MSVIPATVAVTLYTLHGMHVCVCVVKSHERTEPGPYPPAEHVCLPQPQRFPSVLLTLASLLFAAAALAQLTAATSATTRGFSHKCYENKCKKCHRFSSDEA